MSTVVIKFFALNCLLQVHNRLKPFPGLGLLSSYVAVESVLTFVTLQILLTAAEVLSLQGSVGEIIYFENSVSRVPVTKQFVFLSPVKFFSLSHPWADTLPVYPDSRVFSNIL